MAIVKRRAVLRRVATTPATYAYLFEALPNDGSAEVADTGNTLTQAYNEVGALAASAAATLGGTIVQVAIVVDYSVPDS